MKYALVTGITGQDGSYLAELLLEKGYVVHGIIRRHSTICTDRIDHIFDQLTLHYGDMIDPACFVGILQKIRKEDPEVIEVYNLAAQSHVKVSFDIPQYTAQVDAVGALNLLEAVRACHLEKKVKFYQASTSELYGKVQETPQNEETPFYPRSPYGVAKLYAYWIVKNYREAYGIYACNGILFNHESERRGETFLTRKVTIGLNSIVTGKHDQLVLGNLNSQRDWGYAKDYVYGMWLMLQQEEPDDFVLATNETHTVKEFVEKTFALRGFEIKWKGTGLDEIGYDEKTGRELIVVNERYYRPTEVDLLLGDSQKAKEKLGWETETSFDELVQIMVDHDCPMNQ